MFRLILPHSSVIDGLHYADNLINDRDPSHPLADGEIKSYEVYGEIPIPIVNSLYHSNPQILKDMKVKEI